VGTDGAPHSVEFAGRSLGELLAKLKDAPRGRMARVADRMGHGIFAEALDLDPLGVFNPAGELRDTCRIVQTGQDLSLGQEPVAICRVAGDRLPDELGIETNAGVVDPLIKMPKPPLSLGHGSGKQPIAYGALDRNVLFAVRLEGLPAGGVMMRAVAHATAVGFRG